MGDIEVRKMGDIKGLTEDRKMGDIEGLIVPTSSNFFSIHPLIIQILVLLQMHIPYGTLCLITSDLLSL